MATLGYRASDGAEPIFTHTAFTALTDPFRGVIMSAYAVCVASG